MAVPVDVDEIAALESPLVLAAGGDQQLQRIAFQHHGPGPCDEHRIESLALAGEPSDAMVRLRQILEQTPRTRVVDAADSYLHAEATSLIWGYVDDLEILIDAEGKQIHFRSASRTGYSDLGVNRKRVEALAEAWARPEPGG